MAVWQVFAIRRGVHASFPGCEKSGELGFTADFKEKFGAEFADDLAQGEWLGEVKRVKGGVREVLWIKLDETHPNDDIRRRRRPIGIPH